MRMTSAERKAAVEFAKSVILTSKDWQEVQAALAESPHLEAINREAGDDDLNAVGVCQSIIGEAEDELGSLMPPDYG